MTAFGIKQAVLCCSAFLVSISLGALEQQNLDLNQNLARRGSGQPTLSGLATTVSTLEQRVNQLLLDLEKKKWLNGRDGLNGTQGRPGRVGLVGEAGPAGPPGQRGAAGVNGTLGPRGRIGLPGRRKTAGLKYIRWGKKSCRSGAQIVYRGRVGGEWYNHIGGAAEYVCLPLYPQYLKKNSGTQSNGAFMYGAEYENANLLSHGSMLNSHDVPCAVCYVPDRATELMIPARYTCPAGWTREYYGYLMTAYHNHKHPTKFVCVDRNADYAYGSYKSYDGALLYPVEGICGALPCRPYVGGYELTCAVCTK